MKQHIVLVEPKYYTKYPPFGLLKLSSLEKKRGNSTELIRKNRFPKKKPGKIYVTSLFTWAWQPVWQSIRKFKAWFPDVELTLGGLYASLMPEHAKIAGPDNIHVGLHYEAEALMPDYSLVPNWDASIVFSSRGCVNKCPYCVVPKLEGSLCFEKPSIKNLILPGHKRIIFFDNNILAMKYWRNIFEEVIDLQMEVDFNQGLYARLVDEEVANFISKMKIPIIRLAYDLEEQREHVKKAIHYIGEAGISKRKILVYTLFNYTESPDEFFERVKEILNWGAVCYPMRFQPVNTLKKDSFVSSNWTQHQLNMVAKSRRVIGYGGAFPPYKALRKKWEKNNNFNEAFKLYPTKRKIKKDVELKKLEKYFH